MNAAQQNHWSERGRATSVGKADTPGRPHRSVLSLGKVRTRMIHRDAILPAVVVVVFLTVGLFGVTHLNSPRVIAKAVSPDGVEMCIIQRCNWGPELFTTGFYYRRPGTTWGWFYYDHQDSYWGRGTVALDVTNTTAVFLRDGVPAVTFDWTAERYTLHRINRTLTGAQNWAPAGAPDPY